MKNNILEYKRYIAQLDLDLEDRIIIGKVINTREIISFHSNTLSEIQETFKNIIDTYIAACEDEGISPSRPYSGKFNLRINPDLHRELSIEAAQEGISLNELTEHLIQLGLSRHINI